MGLFSKKKPEPKPLVREDQVRKIQKLLDKEETLIVRDHDPGNPGDRIKPNSSELERTQASLAAAWRNASPAEIDEAQRRGPRA